MQVPGKMIRHIIGMTLISTSAVSDKQGARSVMMQVPGGISHTDGVILISTYASLPVTLLTSIY